MAVSASSSRRFSDTQISPERNKVWIEPPNKHKPDPKVPVVYYLSRNGQLEHPHFMEVPLSSPRGLYLTDVINRLNVLRGKGMASLYSWSCKRSYRNGFVWHDLSDNDFIYPAHGQEYVLKGSELLEGKLFDSVQQPRSAVEDGGDISDRRRRNQSCSSIDFNNLHEYNNNVYQAETSAISPAADASTQTDDTRRRRRRPPAETIEEKKTGPEPHRDEIETISPPPSDSSPETLETLMKADKRLMLHQTTGVDDPTASIHRNGNRGKSSVLMQLITCGSISFKDCGAGSPGLGLMSHYKMRLPRAGGGGTGSVGSGRVKLEEKEYFSGSLVETKKKLEIPALKRSTSYNADGSSKLEIRPSRETESMHETKMRIKKAEKRDQNVIAAS